MDEYSFILDITKTVLNNFTYYNINKIKPLINLLSDKLYHYEQQKDMIHKDIEYICDVFIKYNYNYGKDIECYDLLNINISNFTYDTQLGILYIRLVNYIEYLNKKKKDNNKWYQYFIRSIKLNDTLIQEKLSDLNKILKINRLIIVQNYLLIQEFKNILTQDTCTDESPKYDDPIFHLILLRVLFDLSENIDRIKYTNYSFFN